MKDAHALHGRTNQYVSKGVANGTIDTLVDVVLHENAAVRVAQCLCRVRRRSTVFDFQTLFKDVKRR